MPYVVLRVIKRISDHGKMVTYHPGDSINVGKQTAEEWILDGSAYDPYGQVVNEKYTASIAEKGSQYGVRLLEEEGSVADSALSGLVGKMQVSYGPPECPYPYTFIWKTNKPVSMQLVRYGFLRIDLENPPEESWEMAAMLVGLDKELSDVPADERTRKASLEIIGDLGVPVYEPRAIWCRDTDNVKKLLTEFSEQLDSGVQGHHAFMRALYKNPVSLCTLPKDWTL